MVTEGPYRGILPYSEDDESFFYGRDSEKQIIIENIFASRFTLLYGANGVGKTSLICAGIAPRLAEIAQQNLRDHGTPEFVVVVYDDWGCNPSKGFLDCLRSSIPKFLKGASTDVEYSGSFSETVARLTNQFDVDLYIILDHFEDYFVNDERENREADFASELSGVLNRPDLRVNLLVSIGEEMLARMERFKGKISGLFENHLRIRHLNESAAYQVIVKPIEQYNMINAPATVAIEIEPELVQSVIHGIKVTEFNMSDERLDCYTYQGSPSSGSQIPAPFLQLVMSRIWDVERRDGSSCLRDDTLRRLGGVEEIVRSTIGKPFINLTAAEQDVAAVILPFLITNNASRIGKTITNLTSLTGLLDSEILPVLAKISGISSLLKQLEVASNDSHDTLYRPSVDLFTPYLMNWAIRHLHSTKLKSRPR